MIDRVMTFFDRVDNIPRILHQQRFSSRLSLPPCHPDFPHPALLHAICGCAARWADGNDYRESFITDQVTLCKKAIFDALEDPTSLLDTVRALVILTRLLLDEARMMDCWTYGGFVSQMILPLRWHLRAAQPTSDWDTIPSPLVDQLDRSEGHMIFWMAFLQETIASLGSGLGGSFALDEITAPLPAAACHLDFGSHQSPPNPQHIDSPDLWSNHPVNDPFVMVIKAAILLNRANKYARLWKARQYDGSRDDFVGAHSAEFRSLTDAIGCFQ